MNFWKILNEKSSEETLNENTENVEEELADVLIYSLLLAHDLKMVRLLLPLTFICLVTVTRASEMSIDSVVCSDIDLS